MEERRLLLAVALSLLVLTGYRLLFPPPPPKAPPPAPVPREIPSPSPSPSPTTVVAAPVAPARPSVADDQERRVEVRGKDFGVAFTNRGARLISFTLAKFKDQRGTAEEMVQTIPGGPRPLDVETGIAEIDARLKDALFKPSSETLNLESSGEPTLRFEYAQGDLLAVKTLRFQPKGYLIQVAASVRQAGRELPKKVLWGPGLGNPTDAEMEVRGYQEPQAAILTASGVERLPPAKISGTRTFSDVAWAGVESQYFAALLVPPQDRGVAEVRVASRAPGPETKGPRGSPVVGLANLGEDPVLLYVGPKDHHTLAALNHNMVRVVPLGDWLGPLVVFLMGLLRWVHEIVGNYGWSIVVLTAVINLALGPLRHYSIANGMKMAKMGPEMKVIQERYRKIPALDPRRQEMQKEMAALYERHGMNMSTQMLLGCLPILLTMPFLFAFYQVLQISVELRGASFLWIRDLSQKDPLFMTPILMGISMFIMQRMTPSAMDPAQQRMMMIMPLVFVVMLFAAPAGLNLYWLASNVCSIIQQGITLRILRGHDEGGRKDKEKKRR